jgi:non-ribosomal peptide synthetase component F
VNHIQSASTSGQPDAVSEDAVKGLGVLTPAERKRLLVEWNDTAQDVPAVTMPELLEEQVARSGDADAVVFEGEVLSYAELNARANRLARYLVSLGAGPERLVAVALPRSLDMVVAVLAVLKSGAAYVPVDLEYPVDRIAYVLADARPAAVVTVAGTEDVLPADVPRVVLDDPRTAGHLEGLGTGDLRDGERAARLTVDHPAYVVYTSGSTGRPKGVVVPHRGVTNFLSWMREKFPAEEFSRLLATASLSFDVSVFEIFGALALGGCVEIVRNALALADGPWSGRS